MTIQLTPKQTARCTMQVFLLQLMITKPALTFFTLYSVGFTKVEGGGREGRVRR